MDIISPENVYNPAMAEDLKFTEIDSSVVTPLSSGDRTYNHFAAFAYNVGGIDSIKPSAVYNPAMAEDLKFAEIKDTTIPHLTGAYGVYPRYAQLIYLLNPSVSTSINSLSGDVVLSSMGGTTLSVIDNTILITSTDVNYISSIQLSVAPTSAQIGTTFSSLSNAATILLTPNINNVGAVYISENPTYTGLNPIYPDPTNNTYESIVLSSTYIFADNVGDSVDLTITVKA